MARPHGRVVRVDRIKPTLKARGAEPLKLKCDELLSNFAFNFNLRRYIMLLPLLPTALVAAVMVGRCRLTL